MFIYSRSLRRPSFRLFTTTSRPSYPTHNPPSPLRARTEDAEDPAQTSTQDPTTSLPEHDADAPSGEAVTPAPVPASAGNEQPIQPPVTDSASSSQDVPDQHYGQTKLRLLEKLLTPRPVPPPAANKTSEANPAVELEPLLPLPSVPGILPAPRWLSKNESMVYFTPLFQRGWYVSTEPLPDGKRRTAFTLKKVFKLRKRVWTASFMKEVADTMVALKHDGTLLLDALSLTAEFHTHDTYAITPRGRIDHPGITLRDIELAIAIEKLWAKRHEDGQANVDQASSQITLTKKAKEGAKMHIYGLVDGALHLRYVALHSSTLRRENSEQRHVCTICGQNHPDRTHEGPCPACLGAHAIFECTVRHTRRPPHPCLNCNDWHWLVDCPKGPYKDPARKPATSSANSQKHTRNGDRRDEMKRELFERKELNPGRVICLACGGRHHLEVCNRRTSIPPKNKCTKCGGMHWTVDCPLQNSALNSGVPSPATAASSTKAVTENTTEVATENTTEAVAESTTSAVSEGATEATGTEEAVGESGADAAASPPRDPPSEP